mmetsp:Transcript_9291/g.18716  ORF Transcript_9291/g.18716 Transcript_9291/m.18716 type:complete len:270 (-) Transcript_9291:1080-1889(-)
MLTNCLSLLHRFFLSLGWFSLAFRSTIGLLFRRRGLDLKEIVHAHLRLLILFVSGLEFFDVCLDALGIKTLLVDQELSELFLLTRLPLELHIRHNLMLVEKFTSLYVGRNELFVFFLHSFFLLFFIFLFSIRILFLVFVGQPIIRNTVLFVISNFFDNVFDASMLTNHFERRFGSYALDGITVIASQQDTQIHKLIMRQIETIHRLRVINRLDHTLGSIGKSHFANQNRSRKRDGIHILSPRRIDFSCLGESSRLSLSLARCDNNRNSH